MTSLEDVCTGKKNDLNRLATHVVRGEGDRQDCEQNENVRVQESELVALSQSPGRVEVRSDPYSFLLSEGSR